MALVTLCPECNTTFRVNSKQLEAHSGDVRCGRCQHVFNSFATLITVEEAEINAANKVDSTVSRDSSVNEADALYVDDKFDDAVPEQKNKRWWMLVNVVLILLLSGQIAYFYRAEISPITRPLHVQYCALFNCTVPHAKDITLLNIESSGIDMDAVQQSKIITMSATIRNYAAFPQALPALKLSLTDTRGQLLASRIFIADDYMHKDASLVQVIEPKQEIDIRLDYQSDELNATGYQLLLLYP